MRTQRPNNPEVNESVGSAGGGADRLTDCLSVRTPRGGKTRRGRSFLVGLELSEVSRRGLLSVRECGNKR